MKRLSILCALLGSCVALSSSASAQDSVITEPTARQFLEAGDVQVSLILPSYMNVPGVYDENGDKQSFDDIFLGDNLHFSSLVFDLAVAYGLIDGFEVGVDLPFVLNKTRGQFEPLPGVSTDINQNGTGIGDVSAFVAAEIPVGDLSVGGGGFVKFATGKHENLDDANVEDAELATGSGNTDVGVFASVRILLNGNAQIDGKGGYILRMKHTSDDIDHDLGDVLFLDAGASFWLTNQIAIGAAFLYYTAGTDKIENPQGDLETIDNSDSNLLSIAPAVIFRATDTTQVRLSTRAQRIGSNVSRVETGIPLSGKNDFYGGIPVTLTLVAEF